jgi:signal transduction histidine kinase
MADSAAQGTVLVIDDEIGTRESLRTLLKNLYKVHCAESVQMGLQLLGEFRPDAIVMDIRMPDVNGLQGLRMIREVDPRVSVIMLTAYGDLETAQEAMRHGANDYIKKPFDLTEMEEVIGRYVERTRLERRRWRAEQDLTALNEQLVAELAQKEHMASLGQKSAELVHDLRNPLTAVLGCVELLGDELRKSKDQFGDRWTATSEYIDTIENSVLRCREITDMWLSLGRRNSRQMKPAGVNALVLDVVKGVTNLAEAREVRIEFQPDLQEIEVAADAVQIFRALHNVIVNSIDAVSSPGGLIVVSCSRRGALAEIRVQDNGCGMDSHQLQHAFDPYFTTKDVNGTGLGLFITRKVVEAHRGTIELESRIHQGSTVTIRLPLLTHAGVVGT